MSLLDDVSIVVTPNGYKAGELYAVIPVPTEGADLINDGDFPLPNTEWTIGGGAEITVDGARINNTVTGVNAYIKQVLSGIVSGKQFVLTYDVITTNGTTLAIEQNSSISLNTSTIGTNREVIFTWDRYNNDVIIKRLTTGTDVTIDNVILQELTSADMDVTRATAATRVDENGLVNYAEIIGSEEVTNGDFTQLPLGTGWDAYTSGSSTVAFTEGAILSIDGSNSNVGVYQQNIFTSGVQYKIVVSVKATASFDALVSETDAASSKGTIGTLNLTTSYQDFSFYYTGTGTWDLFIHRKYGETAGQNQQIYIKEVSVKEVTRDNVPRIDYTGGGCPHILAEPQRTNLVTYSEDFSQWNNARTTDTSNQATSPDGTNNATYFEQNTGETNAGSIFAPVTVIATDYSFSIFAKKKEKDFIVAYDTNANRTYFNISNGTLGNNGSGGTSKIEDYGNGWYRCSVSYTESSAASTNIAWYLGDTNGSTTVTDSGGVYIYGCQLEEGYYATSYIPTLGSTVTRNQDIFTRDGIGSLINSTEGVLFVEIAALSDDETNREITLSDGIGSNYVLIRFNSGGSNRIYTRVDVGSVVQYYDLDTSHTITNTNKIAIRWGVSNFATFINGVKVGSQLSGSSFSADTLNELNFDNGTGGSNFNGKVKQLQVYDTALTDTQLAALTS